jgi:hypothetical protein
MAKTPDEKTTHPDIEVDPLREKAIPSPAFYRALGEFVHTFARVEMTLAFVLWKTAGLNVTIAQTLLSGVRVDEAISLMRRVLEAKRLAKDSDLYKEIDNVLTQLKIITGVRNQLLHHGIEVLPDLTGLITTNKLRAFNERVISSFDISSETLNNLKDDLLSIGIYLGVFWLNTEKTQENKERLDSIKDALSEIALQPWLYKSPSQGGSRQKGRGQQKARPRQPPPSPGGDLNLIGRP